MDKNQKDILKNDAEQLKQDLDNKPKIVRKREVPIRVADPNKSSSNSSPAGITPAAPSLGSSTQDEILRRNLGL